ncbi:MAG TPA: WXG100 family type VII secretion target [Micromonosporaceae bacterium]|jgi:WXG100 family type VII secretion target
MRAPSGAERIEQWLGPAGAAYSVVKPIVEFLAHPLDSVTGDPDQLRATAEAWRAAADQVEQIAESEQDARVDLLSYWEGAAAEAFATEMAMLNRSLHEIAGHFDGTAELLDASAEGAREAQDLVEQIVRELIAWAIVTILVAIASSWITFGASVAAGAAATGVEAGLAGTRAAAVAARLAALLRRVSEFLMRMSRFAKEYGLLRVHRVGVQNWAAARFASANGYQLIATNWVIKQTIAKPALGPTVDRLTGADKAWDLPQIL